MSEQAPTPRINAPYLENFTGQTVIITGKVTQLRGEVATIDANGEITVLLNREAHLRVGHAVEIVGKVNQDLTVKVLLSTNMGDNIDFNMVNAVVDATHRFKNLFYANEKVNTAL